MSPANKVLLVALLAVIGASLVLLYRIRGGEGNNILALTLVNVNLILVVVVALLLSRNLVKWAFEGGRLSGLRTRLVVAFFGFSLIPTVLLFVVASGLLTNSVDGWFSPQVEGPMQGAVEVAREHYRELHQQVGDTAQGVATRLARRGPPRPSEALQNWLEQERQAGRLSGLGLMLVKDGAQLARAGAVGLPLTPPNGRNSQSFGVPEGELVRAGTPVGDWGYLVAERVIPSHEIERLRRITEGYENFAQLSAYREPIKKGYRLSFLVIALVVLFSASWFGFFIARSITTPLQRLVVGTREVAAGNLNVRLGRSSKDEVGELVDGFNAMTAQLATNKEQLTETNRSLTESNRELEQRRAYMEAILEHADTGVIALDAECRVTLFNRAASEMLELPPSAVRGRLYKEALAHEELAPMSELISRIEVGSEREQELQLIRYGRPLTLQVHGRRVTDPGGAALGTVLVFANMTELIRGQKEAAWREVAQRLAHEIKNPLTPIQLSVQRLRKKYSREGRPMPAVVEETATTILEEVGGLKRLVDEFSQFARLPEAELAPHVIWELICEVATLYRQAYPNLTLEVVESDLGSLSLDKKQMRQVFTNLFDNAAQILGGEGAVRVSGRRVSDGWVEIRVADNGPGIPETERDKVFQPYYTQRQGGTGLGLAIVQRILEEHLGRIRVAQADAGGAEFILSLPSARGGVQA